MPLVALNFNQNRLDREMTKKLAKYLTSIVASALHVQKNEAAHLKPSDVEVWGMNPSDIDINGKDVEILIWAGDYPERRANLEERKELILTSVRTLLADYDRSLTGYVQVMLQPIAYGEL